VKGERERLLPAWMPNPIDSIGLFAVEALAVVVMALVAVGLAAFSLWLF
jgi:hypothetical protein